MIGLLLLETGAVFITVSASVDFCRLLGGSPAEGAACGLGRFTEVVVGCCWTAAARGVGGGLAGREGVDALVEVAGVPEAGTCMSPMS